MAAGQAAVGRRRLSRVRLRVAAQVVFVLVALSWGAFALRGRSAGLHDTLSGLDAWAVLRASLLLILALVLSATAWRSLLAGLGSPLAYRVAVPVFLVTQTGKYLPGSLWPLLAQVSVARRHGVPRSRMAAASLASVGYAVGGAGVLGGALVLTSARLPERLLGLAALCLGLALAWQGALNLAFRLAARVTRRPVPERIAGRGARAALLCSFGASASQALAVWSLLPARPDAVALAGAWGLASVAGLVVVLAPAGLGVRESVFTALLGAVAGVPTALTLALLSRVLLTAVDLVLGGLAGAALGLRRRRASLANPPGVPQS